MKPSKKRIMTIGVLTIAFGVVAFLVWHSQLLPPTIDGHVTKFCTYESETDCFRSAGIAILRPFRNKEDADTYVALATVVLCIATVILAFFTIKLSTSTERLWKAGERQIALIQQAVQNSTVQLSQTADAFAHAKDTATRELRAYISITEHRAHNYKLEPGTVIVPCFTLRNRGKTPANNVLVTCEASYVTEAESVTNQITWNPDTSFSLAPGEQTKITNELPRLDGQMIADITAGTHGILLLGQVRYKDVFGVDQITRMRASSFTATTIGADNVLQLLWFGDDNDAT